MAYIEDRKIQLAPIYYESGGQINIQKRLGCMGCPLASNRQRLAFFKERPRMVLCYIRAAQHFLDEHPHTKTAKRYANAYEYFARDLFYPLEKDWQMANNSLFGKPNWKDFLENVFGIDLTI